VANSLATPWSFWPNREASDRDVLRLMESTGGLQRSTPAKIQPLGLQVFIKSN